MTDKKAVLSLENGAMPQLSPPISHEDFVFLSGRRRIGLLSA